MTSIVNVTVSQQIAPEPADLQRRGCFISQGGTTLAPRTSRFLTQLSDLDGILAPERTVSNAAWASGTITFTTSAAHGYPVGAQIWLTISGVAPAGYNGTLLCTVTTSTQFTVPANNPGSFTTGGVCRPFSVSELQAMAGSFFAMGFQLGVYVLELGPGSNGQGVSALASYLTDFDNANYKPGMQGYFYSYLLPKAWDGNASLLSLVAQYRAPSKRTYFFVTTTLAGHEAYPALDKAVFKVVEAPRLPVLSTSLTLGGATFSGGIVTFTVTGSPIVAGQWFEVQGCTPAGFNGWFRALPGTTTSTITAVAADPGGSISVLGFIAPSFFGSDGAPATEFSAAAAMWVTLSANPSDTIKVPPLSFSYLYGVTPFPVRGMGPTLADLKAANTNIVDTGAEGGISNAILTYGRTGDGKPWNYWFTTDWVAINADLDLANAIINGSNTTINPLYYNQEGINRLQAVLANVISRATKFGLVLFPPKQVSLTGPELTAALDEGKFVGASVVNAVPFIEYSRDNPSHYAQGTYNGFSVTFTPVRGFEQITINLTVSAFVTQ